MDIKIEYSLEAELDVSDIVSYYEIVDVSCIKELFIDIKKIEKYILSNPELYAIRYKKIRRVNLKKFPFSFFYFLEKDKVVILRVLHQTRDPKFWPQP